MRARDGAWRRSGLGKIRGSGRWWRGMTPRSPGDCEIGGGGCHLRLLFLPERGEHCSQGHRKKLGAFHLPSETPSLSLLSTSALRGRCSDSLISAAWLLFGCCTFAFQAVSSASEGGLRNWGHMLSGLPISLCKSLYFPVSLFFSPLSPQYNCFAPF